ncbi:aldehyde dehydrogenase family protein [Streptomyces pseudovenezuelae]|uniref:Aldehyde dehydrogenase n=2 Tax=Streptomyces TaxID=1883 RepID=A0A101N1B0_9ACTN|nr:aldehyde dehydrogenase family protein [Streptomyces pseudovenezuelae]KUM84714.1 aldehyde dehydrogenase [Streptomyces pseudovenezuelae]
MPRPAGVVTEPVSEVAAAPPVHLDAFGPNGPYRARNRMTVPDVTGAPLAELSIVPPLFVQRGIAALRSADPLPPEQRAEALERAGRLFATATVGGLDPDSYRHLVSRCSGLPISVVRAATGIVAEAAQQASATVLQARPQAAAGQWRDPSTRAGAAVWTRRGNVFAVHAAGNHPGVHALWLEALALGYRVIVRPSRREPFTPHRLVAALREAGFADDHVALTATDHTVADTVIAGADLSLVYGGDDVVRKYGGHNTVLPQGPGRAKILLTGADWRTHLDVIVDSVADEGGTACINATAVLVEGGAAEAAAVADALAGRLAAIPSLPPQDPDAVLPVQPLAAARAVEAYLLRSARGATAHLGGDGIVDDLGDGSAVLRPAVFRLDRADAPQTGVELGFPCVWVAPWTRADGIAPLRESLVLTAITDDEQLVERLVDEPTISNVYVGDHPTYWMRPGLPHDRYLAEFLMRTKTVLRD